MAGQVAVVWEGLLSGPETEIRGWRRSSSSPRRGGRALLGRRSFVVRDLRRDTVFGGKVVGITGSFWGLSRETGFCGNCVGSIDFRKSIFGGEYVGISDVKGAFFGRKCLGIIDWPCRDESPRDAEQKWRRNSSLKCLSTEAFSWEERFPAKTHLSTKKPVRGLSRGLLFARNYGGITDKACGNDALGDAQKKWQRKTSLKGLSTEPSTSEDNSPPANSDSEGGAPMGNSSFVQKFLRLLSGFVQKLGSLWKGRGRRQFVLWSLLGCGLWMVYLSSSVGGNASPRLVPYSELVDHLEAKTVSNALFEEGSSHLYFNLKGNEKDSVVVVKQEELASTGKELTSSTSLAQEGSIEVADVSAGINDEVTGPLNEVSTLSVEGSDDLTGNTGATLNALNEDSGLKTGAISSQKANQKASRKAGRWAYTTRRVKNDENFLLPLMREAGVRYSSAPQSMSAALRTVLITIITLWIPLSPLLWLLHRQMSQSSANGKKKRTISRLVKFEDVAGVDIARAELMEIVDCMRGATKFASLGAKVPKGVLLVGPPGTGKTLLARAVAGEAGMPFFATSASEFVEMFVGRGAARIRELFSEARKNAPSIVFIDELDAVGGRRGRSYNDERDQTLNQLLTEMDGFDSGESGVLVLAATNRPEALDPALCRPGRLSRRVHVTEPDLQGRQQVLAVHMRGVPVEDDPLLLQRLVASMTGGFVGADLANLVNEAALLAARKGRTAVVFADFKEAIDRVKYGVGDRRRTVFTEVEQRFGSWLNSFQKEAVYPTLGSSS